MAGVEVVVVRIGVDAAAEVLSLGLASHLLLALMDVGLDLKEISQW